MERYYSMVQRVITSRGGTLTRTDPYNLGIKLLGTFGAPVAHPDDPDRAVDAALELTHQLEQYNHRLLEELPPELHREPFVTQRIGVTLGIIFAGEVGWKARREYTVMGDEVNLAARLMTKAQPGQILISERVYERVRDSFDADKVEPLHLKGKSQPVQAYRRPERRCARHHHEFLVADAVHRARRVHALADVHAQAGGRAGGGGRSRWSATPGSARRASRSSLPKPPKARTFGSPGRPAPRAMGARRPGRR